VRREALVLPLWLAATLVCVVTAPSRARAQDAPAGEARVYVVESGDTLGGIAQRLGVSTVALASRNHLDPPYTLRVGRRLRLPHGVAPEVLRGLPHSETTAPATTNNDHASPATAAADRRDARAALRGTQGWGRPRRPGFVRFIRENNDEGLAINLRRTSRPTLRRMERFLRFSDGQQHPVHPRLLRLLAVVSDHFGGRTLRVVSGFRPFRRGQWTAHSNHNVGSAIDFRIDGVPNRALRDFCRTLVNTGCGYYPRSVFVHLDVRAESATWVDWSRPGQRPIYGREGAPPEVSQAAAVASAIAPPGVDEGVDDVAADNAQVRNAPPPANNDDDDTAPAPAPVPPRTPASPRTP
jgi:uncharacterized protein YcbK (DUF882 family)